MVRIRSLDHYKLLETSEDVGEAEIALAFAGAIQSLPEGRMDRLVSALMGRTAERYLAAYLALSDVERRNCYDRYLEQS